MATSLKQQNAPLTGILLMLAAMLVLPFLDVAAKFLGQMDMPVVESVWARFFFAYC